MTLGQNVQPADLDGLSHVLVIVENLPAPRDRRVWQETLALRHAGLDVSVISPKGSGADAGRETVDGIEIHRHALRQSAGGAAGYVREYAQALLAESRLARAIHRRRPFQVVHVCSPPDLLHLVGRRFRRRHGAVLVFDHHDLSPELYEAKYGRRDAAHRALLMAERGAFRAADVVIAPNESYRQIAQERGGVAPDRVFVVRSAPDLRTFRPNPQPRDHRRGRKHLIGYVGVLGEHDGLDILLRAVRRLADSRYGRDLHVAIIGDGPHAPALRSEAARLGLEGQVEFTGWQSGPELVDRLAACDVAACPDPVNAFNDRSTMVKVMEYMALGLPVVQFDTVEGRFSAGDAALYATPGNEAEFAEKLALLLDSPELRRGMGEAGRVRVERELAWRHQVPRLLEAYATAARLFRERRERRERRDGSTGADAPPRGR